MRFCSRAASVCDMKIKNLAWMGAGLLLAGVAGAVAVKRRREGGSMPAEPKETAEHAALREILERSAAYNDALYDRVCALENVIDPAERPAAVEELTHQNQQERAAIDALRAALQAKLVEHGCTFADVDGFVPLISQYRAITLVQQKRHLEVFHRVRRMENVPSTPELHAYLKLGFREEEQKQADTAEQIQKFTQEQRDIMLRVGRILGNVTSTESATTAPEELGSLGKRYTEITDKIALYREDDAKGSEAPLAELKSMYRALTPPLKEHAERLRGADFYGNAALRDVLKLLLP